MIDWGVVAAAYGLGSVPVAYLFARRAAGIDLRRAGSGNVGATNLLRTTHAWPLALLVASLDILKGAAAVGLARWAGGGTGLQSAAAVAAVCGHVFPVWLGFHGGKGVATLCGAFAVLSPVATLVAAAVFVGVTGVSRYVSLGSVAGVLTLVLASVAGGAPRAVIVAGLLVSAVVVFRHRDNMVRVLGGTERRLGERV